ncbi:energy transducer TonB [Burkholderia pyrrocinia]|uniref:Energy transducer TonB n=2 Tax=Burkholderia pyrrocinia TaxID=60550 RepID=A0A2Z5NAI6_BURPY|nr:energy transducer TonB [Burkholderia pyrrocinia]
MAPARRPREPLHAVALAVLVVHAAILVALWHASTDDARSTLPRALAVEIDASAPMNAAVPAWHRQPDATVSRPRAHAQVSRDVLTHRDSRPSVPAPRRADQRTPARTAATEAAKPAGEGSRAVSAPSPALPAAASAPTDTTAAAARTVPASPATTAAEPVTAPRFAAAYLRNPAPDYPDLAQQRGWEGTTFLNVHVLANGRPDQVLLSATSGHDALDDAAVAAVRDWRFVPAKRGMEPTDGWVKVPVVFKLGN